MKYQMKFLSAIGIILLSSTSFYAQTTAIIPDLSNKKNIADRLAFNREANFSDGVVSLDARPGDGMYILKDIDLTDGRIELDIKGKNVPQQSFVGMAFHGLNDNTFDAVYFRPFNFKNPERDTHSLQYISMPEHDWYELRQNQPGKYENKLITVPDPNDWFHVNIEINFPDIKVFVNDDKNPSLAVSQITKRKNGWIGFWVGNGSSGDFKNLKIYPK